MPAETQEDSESATFSPDQAIELFEYGEDSIRFNEEAYIENFVIPELNFNRLKLKENAALLSELKSGNKLDPIRYYYHMARSSCFIADTIPYEPWNQDYQDLFFERKSKELSYLRQELQFAQGAKKQIFDQSHKELKGSTCYSFFPPATGIGLESIERLATPYPHFVVFFTWKPFGFEEISQVSPYPIGLVALVGRFLYADDIWYSPGNFTLHDLFHGEFLVNRSGIFQNFGAYSKEYERWSQGDLIRKGDYPVRGYSFALRPTSTRLELLKRNRKFFEEGIQKFVKDEEFQLDSEELKISNDEQKQIIKSFWFIGAHEDLHDKPYT